MAETAVAVKTVDRDELKKKIDSGESFVLLETLAPEYFRHGHLPGAVNMPPDRLKELAPTLAPDKQAEVITYCTGPACHASSEAAHQLTELGYTNVRQYAGGKEEWTAAGFPLERGDQGPEA
jgi:rhodanese-related sulfurtransferase